MNIIILLRCFCYLLAYVAKAYDSVPRVAIWCALQKYSVPDVMIELMLMRSLHDGMFATATVGGARQTHFLFRMV